MYALHLFYIVATYWFNTCSGVPTISENKNLQISEEITIESPGYPRKNYERNTTYTWMVTAPELTEEIEIGIELDVHHIKGFPCYDYLKIQEIKDSNFVLFKRCGKLTTKRTARGNKLLITLYSNFDILTGKGFRLRLKVSKISTRSTIMTTLATTTLPLTKTAMKTKTTTSTKKSFPQTSKTRIKATSPKIFSTQTPSTIAVTTIKTIKTTFPNWKATQPTTSKEIMSKVFSSLPATLYSSLPSLPSTVEIVETSKTTDLINSEIPVSSSTKLDTGTSTETTPLSLSQEMVILMVGVGVVEVTIIIVGILAVRRHRQQRNNTTRPNKANDGRPVSRKTVCSIDNVYATIPDEACDENPYKDFSKGVYDTTSKRRSHVHCSRSEYSRGSFYSRLFRGSNTNGRMQIEEAHPMSRTFRDSKKGNKKISFI